MVKKIVISIFISIIIACTVFLGVMHIPVKTGGDVIGQLDYEKIQEEFFFKKSDVNEKKIFIIGSSYTQALNTT